MVLLPSLMSSDIFIYLGIVCLCGYTLALQWFGWFPLSFNECHPLSYKDVQLTD